MPCFTTRVSALLVSAVCLIHLAAAAEAELCAELSPHFPNGQPTGLQTAARKPTEAETLAIQQAKYELREIRDYSNGVLIADADNDGRDDLLVWSTQGSGRFVFAELHDAPGEQRGAPEARAPRASMNLGVLMDPQVFRFKGVNYIVFTGTGDSSDTTVSRLVKTPSGRYDLHTVCHTRVVLQAETGCRHPACKHLKQTIENERSNEAFRQIEWPHKYMAPAGLAIFSSEDAANGDFDNTKRPTLIWKTGREHYDFEHVYWRLLGQGDTPPVIDPALRPESDSGTERSVLPGAQHDRLRRTLAEQSEVLSRELRKSISLPSVGEFFLFTAHEGRTYWAWDFGEPPLGEQIHITYTNANQSDYIGSIRVKRTMVLQPCTSKCIIQLDR